MFKMKILFLLAIHILIMDNPLLLTNNYAVNAFPIVSTTTITKNTIYKKNNNVITSSRNLNYYHHHHRHHHILFLNKQQEQEQQQQQQQKQQQKRLLMSSVSISSLPILGTFLSSISATTRTSTLLLCIGIHVFGGLLGVPIVATGTKQPDGWYNRISLPKWTPTNKIFGPVWTLLYTSMGIIVSQILFVLKNTTTSTLEKQQQKNIQLLLYVWIVHYICNLLWAPIFFGLKKLRFGLYLNIGLLLSLVIGIIPMLYTYISPFSSYILLPYTIWVGFATILNYTICKLNPTNNGYNNAMFQSDLNKIQIIAAQNAGFNNYNYYS